MVDTFPHEVVAPETFPFRAPRKLAKELLFVEYRSVSNRDEPQNGPDRACPTAFRRFIFSSAYFAISGMLDFSS
ncbi:hypothetical protein [Hyphomicrobium sp. 2TAF46]|uniref:hypothetical protein n=1 Tax=Hyphomicrobium sp. 2TAF46 TaxID=3233019 RepID=UPI003F920FB0